MVIADRLQEELNRFAFWLRYPARGRRPMGDATVRSYLYSVRRLYQFLGGRELSQEGMEELVRRMLGAPAFQKRLPRWLTDQEWTQLLQAAERPRWDKRLPQRARVKALFHRAVLMVYGGAGLRLAEGCALLREDVDPDWCPDGQFLVYQPGPPSVSSWEVYRVKADGTGETNITLYAASDRTPDWGP